MTHDEHRPDRTGAISRQQDGDQKNEMQRTQRADLANLNITQPVPVDASNDDKKRPEPAGLENQNITKPDLGH